MYRVKIDDTQEETDWVGTIGVACRQLASTVQFYLNGKFNLIETKQ